jgi:flagellar motor protein MotB
MADYDDDTEEEDDGAPTAPFWMTTFSDMVTLLLTFFVLIVSMSTVEIKKFHEALSYFQGRTSVLSTMPSCRRPRNASSTTSALASSLSATKSS